MILLLGMAGAEGILCAVGGGLILTGILWSLYRRGEEIVFEAEQVVVKTRFSREMYPYEGMNFLLRRSWTVTFHRGLTAGGGLAGVAIQLRRGKRAEVTVPAARFDGRTLREAIDFLSQLPIKNVIYKNSNRKSENNGSSFFSSGPAGRRGVDFILYSRPGGVRAHG